METTRHTLGSFETALDSLQGDLLMMASLVERNLRNAISGLIKRDDDLCNVVIADEEEIDLLEKQVDFSGIELLRRFQPVASDLRQVVAAMKLNINLERISDQAVGIAKKARKLNRTPPLNETPLLEPMFHEATGMLKDAMRAFTGRDVELALSIKPRDKKLDDLNQEVGNLFTESMAKSPDRIADYVSLLFIARHLERVGDHAKNIAEEIVYAISAEDIRHVHPAGPA